MLEKRGGDSVDGELLKQLSSRRLQYDSKARIQLEPEGSRTGRIKLRKFANSVSEKNTRISWGWWKSLS
jgi:hypothetical protein